MVVRPSKGGAFAHVAQLSSELIERGHAVAVAGPHGAWRERLAAEILDVDLVREVSPTKDLRGLEQLAGRIRAWKPDLIHAHGSKGATVARLARLANPRTPLVFTPHNYAFTNYFVSAAQRWRYKLIERGLAPLATRVICVCEAEREVAASIGPRQRTRVAYNGIVPLPSVDPDPAIAGFRGAGSLICAVTELQPPKGVPTLIEAMPTLVARHPGARLVIAGGGPMEADVKELIESLDVQHVVRLLGHVGDIPALLAATDVFVSPGWSESFPYAILEAMSLALPIVATDVGGVGEAIENEATGLLVPPHDAATLARAIGRLVEDRDLAGALGQAAQDRQRDKFQLGVMVDSIERVYAELLQK